MKLYYEPGASSLSPHIVLREAGLSFDLEKVDMDTKRTERGADFNSITPKSYVPALMLDDGQVLTEGSAIVQYLADLAPEKKLAPPAGTMERYRLQEMLNYITSELHKSFGTLFSINAPDDWKSEVKEQLIRRIGYVAGQIDGKPYVMGADFTVADAYLFTVLSWSASAKVDLSRWPAIQAYQARVAARSAVQETLKAEGLVK